MFSRLDGLPIGAAVDGQDDIVAVPRQFVFNATDLVADLNVGDHVDLSFQIAEEIGIQEQFFFPFTLGVKIAPGIGTFKFG